MYTLTQHMHAHTHMIHMYVVLGGDSRGLAGGMFDEDESVPLRSPRPGSLFGLTQASTSTCTSTSASASIPLYLYTSYLYLCLYLYTSTSVPLYRCLCFGLCRSKNPQVERFERWKFAPQE